MTTDEIAIAPQTGVTSDVDAPTLVGRTRELAAISQLLAGGARIVTITGPGGVGKTRLATAAAEAARQGRSVAFVPLAGVRDPDHVLSTLVECLDLPVPPGRGELDVLADQFGASDALVVVDNLEHVISAAPLLRDVVTACPGVTLLVTSRAPMRVAGEDVVALDPLAVPDRSAVTVDMVRASDAAALLVQAATVHDAAFEVTEANASAIAEICERLDGLPLALELAAARLRLLAPQQMVGLLDRRLDLLRSADSEDAGHHATLRATIGWSVDLLPTDARERLASLGVFDGGFDLGAAAAVVGLDPGAALAGIEVLVENHLVRVTAGLAGRRRFDLLETIREYALGELIAEGRERAVRDAHADWFCAVAARAAPELEGPDPLTVAASLAPDIDNFRAAMAWVSAGTDVADTRALRLTADLSRYWWTHGQLAEGGAHLARAVGSRRWPPSEELAEATRRQGNLLLKAGDMDGGRRAYLHSIEVNEQLGDELGLARARSNLGNILSDVGDIDGAERMRLLALPVLDGAPGYERALASTLNGLAFVALQRDDLDNCAAYLSRAIATLRAVGDAGSLQTVIGNLAEIHAARGDLDGALAAVDEALDMARAQHDTYETHGYSIDRAEILVSLDRLDEAEATLGELFSGSESLSPKQEAAARCAHGGLQLARRRYRSAAVALVRAFEQADAMQHWGVCVTATDRLGLVAARTGEDAAALRLIAAATVRREANGGTRRNPLAGDIAAAVSGISARTAAGELAEHNATGTAWGADDVLRAARRIAAAAPDEVVVPDDPRDVLRTAGLTPREAEIALLLAERRTDQEIADALIVSVRTVTTHVSAVLRKLDVSSRRDVRGAIAALRDGAS